MGIRQDQTINLKTKEVLDFIQQPGEAEFRPNDQDVLELLPDFEKLSERPIGTTSQLPTPQGQVPLKFSWAVQETWAVYRTSESGGEQYVESVDIIVPFQRDIKITTISVLQAHKDLTTEQKEKLKEGLADYDPTKDPIEWATQQLPQGVSFSQFDVQQTFSVKRLGQEAVPNEKSKFAILARLRANEEHDVRFVSSVVLEELPEPAPSNQVIEVQSEHEAKDPQIAEQNVTALVEDLAGGCDGMAHWQEKVADIFVYPEFKLNWELRTIKIGCVRIKLHLPVLYVRSSTIQLWVFGAWISDVGGVIEQIVKKCALRGVGAGIVASLVLFNFGAGVAAFKAVFFECVIEPVGQTVKCVIPGLMLLTYRSAWSALW